MHETPNPLKEKLTRLIQHNGPITIAEYMHICMADPEHGYYKQKQAIGRTGDFITAPEISQMFGELLGIWCIAVWRNMGCPSQFCLAELGPGKGTLMSDVLRATNQDPTFMSAVQVVLIETSDHLKETQKAKLPEDWASSGKLRWELDINALPAMPTLLIANEFMDVIPFRQYTKTSTGWNEVGVGLNEHLKLQKVALAGTLDQSELPPNEMGENEGSVYERSPAREAIIETISQHLAANSGAALVIDYGHLKSGFGDTFQALKSHQYVDIFEEPGEADLTSHVDFQALMSVSEKFLPSVQTTTQGDFLLNLGLLERAGQLGAGKDTQIQEDIRAQVERLAGPDQMGSLFKVMGLASEKMDLPGFQTG